MTPGGGHRVGDGSGHLNAGFEYVERIGAEGAGLSVLEYLARRYRHSSEGEWRERIRAGRVLIEDRRADPETRLRWGQRLVWRRPAWREPETPRAFALLYEDGAMLAAAKPAGLPTLPGGGFLQNTLLALVRRRYPDGVPVHRLDRGASGVVLLARTAAAAKGLAGAFRRGEVEKDYRALVLGDPVNDSFLVEHPIGRAPHPSLGMVHVAATRGADQGDAGPGVKAARTQVRVLERRTEAAVVAVRPVTGRPHQIRIHLAAAGHPLVGDPFYVTGGLPRGDGGQVGQGGFLLHAERIALPHPETGRPIVIECAPPPALRLQADPVGPSP